MEFSIFNHQISIRQTYCSMSYTVLKSAEYVMMGSD